MSDFVHLHCHTEYSLLDGAIRLKDLCARAKDYGMSACAITDHGNMFGAAYFFKACKEFGLNPIFGCEVYTCHDHTDQTDPKRNHLILLAENNTGYHNLVKLVTHSYLDGFYYKPRVDKGMLRKYQEGLICLSACIVGEIPSAILADDLDKARSLAMEFNDIFPERFYLELQSNGLKEQTKVNNGLLALAEELHYPIVATNDCHYLDKSDYEAHEVLLAIGTKKTMNDPTRMSFTTNEFYYKSPEEMSRAFADTPKAIENTLVIANKCKVELDMGHHYFPVYPLPEGASIESEFCRLAEEGLEQRLAKHPQKDTIDPAKYRERLKYEIGVILDMGFPDYFLIVQEFINWAKDHGIPVGPGRGSAAGSLVAWSMRITNLDPLPYNLLFERFLNIERVSLPDIDVDFCERRRTEVIQHMRDTYGANSVAQITTFGTMKARGVVRDVGRALDVPLREVDKIAKLIPSDPKMTIKKALESEPELKTLYDTDPKIKHLLQMAQGLEGLTRHASTHAAGLVVSDKPMEEYLPLYTQHDELVTQFDGPMTEQTGLVKFDFLGLKTMTMIFDTLDNIKIEGKTPPDLDNLSLEDKPTYQLFCQGDTDGIFQVESSGMRQYLRQLQPSCFEDIIAMLALYRPGPLGSGMVDEFIKRKHGEIQVVYPHESLAECLKDTYGVIVYQEQVMQIAQIIANYTLGGADLLRRAMGKKKAEAMAQQRSTFLKGAAENGISEDKANEIFDLMEKFAAYGFNKSHSAAYALVSYYTAYLKVHYKVEFMAALMSSEMGDQDKLIKYMSCCKDMGIDVLPPLVNHSSWFFTAHEGKVVFGLGAIKNVGQGPIESVLEARKKGPFLSLLDLCTRVAQGSLNKRTLEALIKAGACDCFEVPRKSMLEALDKIIAKAQRSAKQGEQDNSLLGLIGISKSNAPKPGLGIDWDQKLVEMDDDEKLQAEKDVLGLYLTSHPLHSWELEIKRQRLMTIEGAKNSDFREVKLAALIVGIKETVTKTKGQKMAFVSLEDLTGRAELVVFPKDWERVKKTFVEAGHAPMVITGSIEPSQKAETNNAGSSESEDSEENQPQELKLIFQDIVPLEEASNLCNNAILVRVPNDHLGQEAITELKGVLEANKGERQVTLLVNIDRIETYLKVGICNVKPSVQFYKEITAWLKKPMAQAS
ncbi:MAG: DNA polymerase III subunit alpha [Desulfovibrionaceae bacterium]|nr:DNA polymerase III subunit alpha [Desulfovibrionaceae bacterium]